LLQGAEEEVKTCGLVLQELEEQFNNCLSLLHAAQQDLSLQLQCLLRSEDCGRAFFSFFDRNGDNALSGKELLDAAWLTLQGTHPVTREGVADSVENMFGVIDSDGNGSVSLSEFLKVREWILATLDFDRNGSEAVVGASRASVQELMTEAQRRRDLLQETEDMVDARRLLLQEADKRVSNRYSSLQAAERDLSLRLQFWLRREGGGRSWFKRFDRNGDDELSGTELVDALLLTLKGTHAAVTREGVAAHVENVFGVVDEDGNGSVNFKEFQKKREWVITMLDHDQ
jgi:Ca2+-binding EF-hand superfamily protein